MLPPGPFRCEMAQGGAEGDRAPERWGATRLRFMNQLGRNLLLVAVLTSVARPATAQYWPMFRGPEASGVADGQDLPDRWDVETGENILWKTEIAGFGHSSPVVWGDRIFLTTAVSSSEASVFQTETTGQIDRRSDESIHTWWVQALNRHSGSVLWSRKALQGTPRVRRHPKNSYASATPATDGTHLVVVFGSEGLYCFDVDGNLLWTQDLGVIDAGASYDETYDWGPAASPIIFDGMAIVLADGHTSYADTDLRARAHLPGQRLPRAPDPCSPAGGGG
jgi:outer membrane protein assembly factor BamB